MGRCNSPTLHSQVFGVSEGLYALNPARSMPIVRRRAHSELSYAIDTEPHQETGHLRHTQSARTRRAALALRQPATRC